LLAAAGTASAWLGLPAPLTRFRLRNLLADMTFDLQPTRAIAGPSPFSEREGIEVTVEWLRTIGAIPRHSTR
jgi:hypothetical protein